MIIPLPPSPSPPPSPPPPQFSSSVVEFSPDYVFLFLLLLLVLLYIILHSTIPPLSLHFPSFFPLDAREIKDMRSSDDNKYSIYILGQGKYFVLTPSTDVIILLFTLLVCGCIPLFIIFFIRSKIFGNFYFYYFIFWVPSVLYKKDN